MKTIEEIKSEFKNATGKELPIYTFKGQLGALMERKHEYCRATDFIPMDDVLNMEIIDFDAVRWVDVEEDNCDEGEEITDAAIVNPEYDQGMLDNTWSPVSYAKSDEYVRELLVTTTRYHSWTSERSRMVDSLWKTIKEADDDLEYYDDHSDELEAEEKQDRDRKIVFLKDRIEFDRKRWEETCSRYKDPERWEEYRDKSAKFYSVLKEVLGSYQCCRLVRDAVKEYMDGLKYLKR